MKLLVGSVSIVRVFFSFCLFFYSWLFLILGTIWDVMVAFCAWQWPKNGAYCRTVCQSVSDTSVGPFSGSMTCCSVQLQFQLKLQVLTFHSCS